MGPTDIIAQIIGIFTTVFAVAGMQFKNMKVIIVSQLLANGLLALQYVLEGTVTAGGITFLAIVQTVVSFIFASKNKNFPIPLTVAFMVGFTAITAVGFKDFFDVISCVAVWFFAISIVQKRSSISRICSLTNCILWLIYDIARAPSAILTHSVIIVFILIAVIRLDRDDWKMFFDKLVFKKQTNAEKAEEKTEV